jgi:hypothetical protein
MLRRMIQDWSAGVAFFFFARCLPARANRKSPVDFKQACPPIPRNPNMVVKGASESFFKRDETENNIGKFIRRWHTRRIEPEADENQFFVAELKPVRGVLQQMTSSYFPHQIENSLKLGVIGTPEPSNQPPEPLFDPPEE